MATEKQNAANKQNAQKSTGPKTESGKQASAGNALKHGITAKKFLLPGEDPSEVEALYEALREVHQPEDAFMEHLLNQIVMNYYRMNRALRAEAEHSPLANMLLGDHDDRVKNLAAYAAMIRKDIKQLEQALADHKERRAARKSALLPAEVIGDASATPIDVAKSTASMTTPPPEAGTSPNPNHEIQKTNPISARSAAPGPDARSPTGSAVRPAVAPSSAAAPAVQPAQPAATPPTPKPLTQTTFDVNNWNSPPRR